MGRSETRDLGSRRPYPGIDGARYHPGGLDINQGFPEPLPVVLVTTRAITEIITGWRNWPEATRWVASRGTTGSGELDPPAAAAGARCVREELVLAHVLRRPGDLPAIAGYLPSDTWTSDIRYDLYGAMLDVIRTGQRVCRETVADALRERAALIPPRQWQEHYGGRGLPWAMAYLRRLDQTHADRDAARSAAVSLRGEDQQAIARRASRRQLSGPRRPVQGRVLPRQVAAPSRVARSSAWASPVQQARTWPSPPGLEERP